MLDSMESLKILGTNEEENSTLVKLENDIFDTVALVYNMGEENEEVYVLTDMQGYYPTEIEDVADFDWIRIEDLVEEEARALGWR